MKYRKVGRTGLMVSELSLGCMTFGSTTSEKDAIEIVRRAYESGINHFDTADTNTAIVEVVKEIDSGLNKPTLSNVERVLTMANL